MRRRSLPPPQNLAALEYRVYSQFGDDGIIEFLTAFVPEYRRKFVEFGVEDYQEANTRLLLERDCWSGLVIDGSAANIECIRQRQDYWRYDLTAIHSFLTEENVDEILIENGFNGEIGLLSIDVDGNDYWLWEAIESVRPAIVVCEYNAMFGPNALVSTPYRHDFIRTKAHYSNLYAGASLGALNYLAEKKGFRFLGCNSAGNNAYFVDTSLDFKFESPTVERGFVASKFREARNEKGGLLMKTADQCVHLVAHMPVVEVRSGETLTIAQALVH